MVSSSPSEALGSHSQNLAAVFSDGQSFASLCMGRMSVIQYMNSGTTAAVSSEGKPRRKKKKTSKDEPESD